MRSLTADAAAPHAGLRDATHISFLFADDCVEAAPRFPPADPAADAAALADRFRVEAERLALAPTPARPLGVAVSGGADSLALLLLAHAAFPECVVAATVDHGLRAGSADEARFVAGVCASLGVAHAILPLAMDPGGNVQARAREARYDALGRWACARAAVAVATAHHRDDQAETLLMRVARGAGLAGLAGIRATTRTSDAEFTVVRPLLGWSRAELREIVARAGLTPVTDPANDSLLFDRTRARRLLAAMPWLEPNRLAATVAHLAEAEAALAWTVRELLAGRIARQPDGALEVNANDLPAELQRRLLVEALAVLNEREDHPGPKLGRLLETLRGGGTGTIGGVKAAGGALWRLSPAPPRRGN